MEVGKGILFSPPQGKTQDHKILHSEDAVLYCTISDLDENNNF